MGISRLLHHLEPYATPVVLEKNKNDDAREAGITSTKLIIDGPGLAYYAYHQTISRRSQAGNALEAMPTYKEVNVFVFKLLAQLERCGLDIAAIFFDGRLPHTKRETRISRLQTYLNQLINFRAQHPQGPRCDPKEVFMYNDIFASRPIPAKLRNLPAAPFLVPSVIESLQASQYASVTCVVPGEADAFCADLAKTDGGGIVLSGDSDLLVHDLGPEGCVMLFRDIDLGDRGKLKTFVYQPANIASAVGLGSLLPLAFVLSVDCYRTMPECIRLAKEVGMETVGFREFCREYGEVVGNGKTADRPAPATLPDNASHLQQIISQHLRVLDPRISEYVYQVVGTTSNSSSPDPADSSRTMYLPFLIDDPSRASSWRPSTPLRQLAYSTLNLSTQHPDDPTSTEEFQRRGPRIAGTTVAHLSQPDLIAALEELRTAIKECQDLVNSTSATTDKTTTFANDGAVPASTAAASPPFFPCLSLQLLLHTFLRNGEPVPSTSQALAVLQGRTGVLDWEHLHLCAQWQGVLYSLRMVRQCVGLALVMGVATDGVLVQVLEGVQAGLEGLGSLEGLLGQGVEGDLRDVVAGIVRRFGGEGGDGEGGGKGRKRKKQKRMSGREEDEPGSVSSGGQAGGKGNNMFSLLLDQE